MASIVEQVRFENWHPYRSKPVPPLSQSPQVSGRRWISCDPSVLTRWPCMHALERRGVLVRGDDGRVRAAFHVVNGSDDVESLADGASEVLTEFPIEAAS